MLPDFICIGAQRSGSTWLHELLASHTDLYMPTRRKEIHYFDKYFSRGQGWYESFFPKEETQRKVLGEITPDYLHSPACAERIANLLPASKLIVILRNPVGRAYSHYRKLVKDDNFQETFENALKQRPDIIERGFYAAQLQEYLHYFTRSQLCVLVYEDAVANVEKTKNALATFLEVDPEGFTEGAGRKVIHKSYVPRARAAYAFSKSLARALHATDMDWLVRGAKAARVDRLFGWTSPILPIATSTQDMLQEIYRVDTLDLGNLLDIDLGLWKQLPA